MSKVETLDEKHDAKINVEGTADSGAGLKPVSFIHLFRFSTGLEILLDVVGIVAAGAAGAAQVHASPPSLLNVKPDVHIATHVTPFWSFDNVVRKLWHHMCVTSVDYIGCWN
jgi:hypothetical protein